MRVTLAERAIQAHVVRDPSLAATASETIDAGRLHDETRRILQVAIEFPAACQLAGIMDVAGSIAEPIDFLEYLNGLEGLPDWFVDALPTFDAALRELGSPRLIAEAGALSLWQREIVSAKRTKLDRDPLWEAACLEARARESVRAGLIASANDDRRRAAEIIITTAVAERAS